MYKASITTQQSLQTCAKQDACQEAAGSKESADIIA